jgi:hypothetical protein
MTEIAVDVAPGAEPHRQRERAADRTAPVFSLPAAMPLVLDLDGTLIAGDLLYKSFFSILRKNPLIVLGCATWLIRGRAALKRQLAMRNRIDWDRIKLHRDVVALAIREKAAGREVVLATAADAVLAGRFASRLPFIDRVYASDGERNLSQGSGEGRTADTNVSRRLHLCRRQQVGPRGVGAGQRHCSGQRTRGGQ